MPRRSCSGCSLLLGGIIFGSSQPPTSDHACLREADLDWSKASAEMWECVENQALSADFVRRMMAIEGQNSACVLGVATASTIVSAHIQNMSTADSDIEYMDPFQLGIALKHIITSGFPIFGAMEWLSLQLGSASPFECDDELSEEFHALLTHHLASSTSIPTLRALEYFGAASALQICVVGRAAALLAVALAFASQARGSELQDGFFDLLDRAEKLLAGTRESGGQMLVTLGHSWPIWTLLHRLSREVSHRTVPKRRSNGCLVMIYAFPTSEIRADTREALKALETHFFEALQVRYPIVLFTDKSTAPTLQDDLGPFTSAPLVAAVIPSEELTRPMLSYSCVDGVHCVSGGTRLTDAHRANVNKTQFWSPDYLRISRYTAGPLFFHPALDDCGAFMKVDTDFFLTAPMTEDPIAGLETDGSMMAYWQIHVQGQRQTGFMDAALEFVEQRKLRIRNKAFYARGKFEEKAEKLGISVSEVPEALEASTVVYGCLFGGSVQFFREPLYQNFFEHMAAKNGFETYGWSNQFFLGVAAALLFPSQVKRLYISGQHQESKIDIANGNVTEFLLGSMKSVLR